MVYRSRYRARVARARRWDIALGILMLTAATVIMASYLLFAMALDCQHPRLAGAPYCQLVHASFAPQVRP